VCLDRDVSAWRRCERWEFRRTMNGQHVRDVPTNGQSTILIAVSLPGSTRQSIILKVNRFS
jgi:hypothetical protein